MKNNKHQIIFIRGGEAFDTKKQFYNYLRKRVYNPYDNKKNWRNWLEIKLRKNFDLFAPTMPNKQSVDYVAWKIWFEKLFPYIKKSSNSKLILIGQSLGGSFLIKYLSENIFPKKIDQIHLVSPLFDSEGLIGETIGNFKATPNKLKNIEIQSKQLFVYYSIDDTIVPFKNSTKYSKYLKKATFLKFKNRGHFDQPTFRELLKVIKENIKQ